MPRPSNQTRFTESKRERNTWQRLTPLSWVLIGLSTSFFVAFVWIMLGRLPKNSNSLFSFTEATGIPPRTSLASTPTAQQAPTITEAWVTQLTRQPDGAYRGPQELERTIVREVKDALNWSARQSAQSYLQNYEQHARASYLGEWQELELNAVKNHDAFGIQVGGTHLVEMKSIAEDGRSADVIVRRQNIVIDGYDKKSLQKVNTGTKIDDNSEVLRVMYDPSSRIWKPKQTLYRLPR